MTNLPYHKTDAGDPVLNDPKRGGKLYAVVTEELQPSGVWAKGVEWFRDRNVGMEAAQQTALRLKILARFRSSPADDVLATWATYNKAVTLRDYTGRAL